ncbi:24676_t:CDS:2 [Cetraspora pellucida]|uniref:24676_t:CDS:1 n=1 Tax=Cetraspora pellucida TaxID=1433469 RepID=A0A9N9IBI8_9GLOM|nr:24676_t:CDS:2 [Cetraspora pellucida]
MSITANTHVDFLTIEQIKKLDNTDHFIRFLKNQNLDHDNKDLQVLCDQKITGWHFLKLNVNKLMQDSLKQGPAEKIAEFINKINSKEQKDPSYRTYHTRSEEDEEIVQKAFNRTFQNPSNLSERFIQFIDKCLDNYETINGYYVLYTTLVQASGTGKSKLLINVAEKIMTVYCCLRDFKSSSYPFRSNIANILVSDFMNKQEAIATYLAYISTCFQKLQEFNRDFKEWRDWHTNKNSQEKFWRDVKNRMGDIKFYLIKCSVKYLFALDKAHTLVGKNVESKNIGKNSLFNYIRHALILLPKRAGIFAVFSDIHSNISNFSPTSYLNPSNEIAQHGFKLFVPFYLLDTVDINVNFVNFKEAMTLKDDTKEMEPEYIIKLAMDKLIVLQSEYTPDLIANNMCLCIKVLEDHKYIVTAMPTEPMLAEANAQIMNNSHISLTELINKLSEALKKGIVEAS